MKRILTVATVLILICSTAIAYVGNRNTRKFHHNSCSSVYQMKPSNRSTLKRVKKPSTAATSLASDADHETVR